MCGVEKMMKIWGKQETDEYPLCKEWVTVEHDLQCCDPDAIKYFHDLIESLDAWMVEAKMAPAIRKMIKEASTNWKEGQ